MRWRPASARDTGSCAGDAFGGRAGLTRDWEFVETILDASRRVGTHVYLILGGLHLVTTPDAEIERVAAALHDDWHIDRIAPGHCTGEPAFTALRRVFAAQYVDAGLGSTIDLP